MEQKSRIWLEKLVVSQLVKITAENKRNKNVLPPVIRII
jgi:hypothetical protein